MLRFVQKMLSGHYFSAKACAAGIVRDEMTSPAPRQPYRATDLYLLGMTRAKLIALFRAWQAASKPYSLSELALLQNAMAVVGFAFR